MVLKGQCHEILCPLFSTVFTNMGGDTVFAHEKNLCVRRRKFKKFPIRISPSKSKQYLKILQHANQGSSWVSLVTKIGGIQISWHCPFLSTLSTLIWAGTLKLNLKISGPQFLSPSLPAVHNLLWVVPSNLLLSLLSPPPPPPPRYVNPLMGRIYYISVAMAEMRHATGRLVLRQAGCCQDGGGGGLRQDGLLGGRA